MDAFLILNAEHRGERPHASTAIDRLAIDGRARRRLGPWVDDQPQNNDVILSDMDRPPEKTAGLHLLDALQKRCYPAPCVIYAGSASAEEIAETKRRGGFGQTDDPNRLIEMVVEALTT